MSELSEKQHLQLKILKKIITMMDVKRLSSSLSADNKANIAKFREAVIVSGVSKLGILGISNKTPILLNYSEKKAVSAYVAEKLRSVYADDLRQLEKVLVAQKLEEKFVDMHQEREALVQEIENLAKTKLKLLEEISYMRVKPENMKLVENLTKEAKLYALKILYIEKALSSKITTTTSHFYAAMKEVEANLLKVLEKDTN